MARAADPLLAWVEAKGRRLSDPLSGADDIAPLALLDPLLEGVDLVLLGEMDHFIHEKSDFRLLFARWLVDRGWRSFAEELSWSDGTRVERYLATGEGLERLSLFGWTGEQRTDRDDRPTGIFRASFDVYPTALMEAEQSRFYRGLRALAERTPLAYHGVDMDGFSGGGYADIEAALAGRAGVDAFLRRLARVPGESIEAEQARLAALVAEAEALSPAVGVSLAAMADSAAYVAVTHPAKTYEATVPGMAFREGCMKRRFDDVRRLTGDAPTVLMGHALHLAKDDRLLGKTVGVGPGGGLECSLGHHLVQVEGLKAVSVWLVHGAGEDSQPFPDLPRRLAYPADSLNARLAGLTQPVLFPIAGAPAGLFDRPLGVGHMYNIVQPAVLEGQVDAILFLPRVTPMQA